MIDLFLKSLLLSSGWLALTLLACWASPELFDGLWCAMVRSVARRDSGCSVSFRAAYRHEVSARLDWLLRYLV